MNTPPPSMGAVPARMVFLFSTAATLLALITLTGCGANVTSNGSGTESILTTALPVSSSTASSTLVINKGGTYSGKWVSNDPAVPAVQVATAEPVIIENSTVSGRGDLINLQTRGANVTVRNVTGSGLDPQVAGMQRGVFVRGYSATSLTVQNCTITGTSFGVLAGYSAFQLLKILNNKASNLEDRASDGKGGFQTARPVRGHFIQFTKLTAPNGAEIAWNELQQTVGSSSIEDGISIYLSVGTAGTPINVHDNYMEGNSSPVAATYSGNGIITDGDSSGETGYVLLQANQVVHTQGGGMAIANGHDITMKDNRVVSCGKDTLGPWYATTMTSAVTLWNYYGNPGFYNNLITTTAGGLVTHDAAGNLLISDVQAKTTDDTNVVTGNNFTDPCALPMNLTNSSAEDAERLYWQAKQTTNNQQIGDQH